MTVITFFLGFVAGVVVGLVSAFLWWNRYARNRVWIRQSKPGSVSWVTGLQPHVKALYASGQEGDILFVRSSKPKMLIRLTKRVFKNRPAEIEIQLRNSDENRAHYQAVRAALESASIEFRERHTPKLNRPKDIRINVQEGVYAPASLAGILSEMFAAVGVDQSKGILFSSRDPVFWENLP